MSFPLITTLRFRHPLFKKKVSWSSKTVIMTRREGKRKWIGAITINLVININGTYVTTLQRNHERWKRTRYDTTFMQLLSCLHANTINIAPLIFTPMELKWEKRNQAFGIVEGNQGICWGQKVHKIVQNGPPSLWIWDMHAFSDFQL